MDVILDSNIYIADVWLRSQRLRGILEYLAKTRASLILPEVVEQEVRAHVHRSFATAAAALEAAARGAERLGLIGVPAINAATILASSYAEWEHTFRRGVPATILQRVPVPSGILGEVIRRAAYRLPPVRPNGRETRDTMLWLSILDYLRNRKSANPVAFISANTEDFASPASAGLRPELLADLEGLKGPLEYHSSAESFLRQYAEPIGHINEEWIRARLDMETVSAKVIERLSRSVSPDRWFRVVSAEYRDGYEPGVVEYVHKPELSLYEIYIWEVEPEVVQVFLDFEVNVAAECECRLKHGAVGWGDDPEDFTWTRSLTCEGELIISFAAEIRSDTLILGDVEDVVTM